MASAPLVSAAQLAAELAGPAAPTVLDCRWELAGGADRDGYDRGHLPGAVFVDLDRDLSGPPGPGGRHPLPAPGAFQAVMRRAGVGHDRPVVAYDQGQPGGAARAWWLLGWFGHPGARVLDGGLPAWVAAGLPLTTEVPDPDPGDFTARPGGRALLDAAGAAAWPPPASSLTPAPRPGTRAWRSRSTRSPATSPAPATPRSPTSPATLACRRRAGCASSWRPTAPATGSRSAPTAAPGWSRPTSCSPSRSPASRPPCTPAPGASGSPTRPARSRPAPTP